MQSNKISLLSEKELTSNPFLAFIVKFSKHFFIFNFGKFFIKEGLYLSMVNSFSIMLSNWKNSSNDLLKFLFVT